MENPGYLQTPGDPIKEKDPDLLAEPNSKPIVDNNANAKKEQAEKEKDPQNYVAHISEVTLENPVFDPDGVPYDRLDDQGFPDPESLPIKRVVRRRNKITCKCCALAIILLIILAGVGVGIYFVLRLGSQTPAKQVAHDTRCVEGSFRILNRPYKDSYSSVQSTAFKSMSKNITHTLAAMFVNEDLSKYLSDVYVTGLANGSIIVSNAYRFNRTYTSQSLEEQVDDLFRKKLIRKEENGRTNYYLDIYMVESESITFNAAQLGEEPTRPYQAPTSAVSTTPVSSTTTKRTTSTTTTSLPTPPSTPELADRDSTTEFESTAEPTTTTTSSPSPSTSSSTSPPTSPPTSTSTTSTTLPTTTITTTITTTTTTTTPFIDRCEAISLAQCQVPSVPYQLTHFPNLIGQSSQADAATEIQTYLSAVLTSGCHPHAVRFVCGLLTPKCTEHEPGLTVTVPPCRQFCSEFYSRCNPFFPKSLLGLDCTKFPNVTDDEASCIDAPKLEPYTVRLVGGTSDYDGRVEVYHQGSWGTICDHGWSDVDAEVVCRQLGFPGVGLARTRAYFGEGAASSKVWLSNFNCLGTEEHLALCQHHDWGSNICPHTNDAGVICDAENRDVSGVEVRLVGGTEGPWEGRVEVRYDNQWGTICDDDFHQPEADVVCRMLGYNSSVRVAAAVTDGFGVGTGPIWLDGLNCEGDETNIALCRHEGWGVQNCGHFEDVAVMCQSPPSVNPTPRGQPTIAALPPLEVRLVEGPDETRGRVELNYNGTWGTVCKTMFNNNAAAVVCRMLGFNTDQAAYEMSRYGSGTGPIWLGQVLCNGGEASLERCNHAPWGQNECSHLEDVSVSCGGKQPELTTIKTTTLPRTTTVYVPTIEEVRLVGGPGPSKGRLEIFYNRSWGSVCDDGFDDKDASVFCKMMGYRGGIYLTHAYGEGLGMIWMEDIGCRGNETSVLDCYYLGLEKGLVNCGHREDVSISCEEEFVRLNRGSFKDEGVLEVLHNGTWGTVCSDGFENIDAQAACHSIGYRGKTARVLIRSTWGTSSPIWLSEVDCRPGEEDFLRCNHTGWGNVKKCSHYEDVYINCNAVDAPIRLADGPNPREGRVEVSHDNVWGTICNDGFDEVDAGVLCRSLGFLYSGASTVDIPAHKEGTGQIWLENLRCYGTETHITDCRHDGWGEHNCNHDEDVYLRCQNAPSTTPPPGNN